MLFVLVSVTKHRTCGAIDVFLPLVDPTAFSAKKKQKKRGSGRRVHYTIVGHSMAFTFMCNRKFLRSPLRL